MKFTSYLLLFSLAFTLQGNAQDYTLEERNNTGLKLNVFKTEYYTDSTKAYGSFQLPAGTSGGLLSELRHIRIDYIAVNWDTKDTVCRITADKKTLEIGLVTFEIGTNTLQPPYTIPPRLRIKAPDYRKIIRSGDPIEIKLLTKEKITGNIIGFNNTSLTILDENNNKRTITPKEIKGIKFCSYLLAYGRRAIGKNCKFKKLRSIKFDVVEQQYNKKSRYWQWVKIPTMIKATRIPHLVAPNVH